MPLTTAPPDPKDDATLIEAPRELPRRLGPYQLVRVAGSGAMGVVFQARDLDLDRWVAIKRLHAALATAAGSSHAARLVQEARAAARLSHPHVAQVYGLGDDDGLPYIAMEWLEGVDLGSRLRSGGRLPWRDAVAAVAAAASALDAAHRSGLVHRDVKPSNLMQLHDGTIKVVDFGLARPVHVASDLTATGAIIGTPAYMSPEQCLGEPVTPASDLYALGCTLYQLLTGAMPFAAAHALRVLDLHVRAPFPDARRLAPDVPEALVRLIGRATAKSPADRASSTGQWRTALLRLLDAGPVATPGTTDPPARRPGTGAIDAGPPATADTGRAPSAPERNTFIGRRRELQALTQMLDAGHRLVTVVGTGGIGKTRFVSRCARASVERWPGGVHFCDLSEATSAGGMHFAVAQALGVALGNDDPVQRIGHAIAGRGACLVVLDNFEQLVALAGSTVATWLDRCGEAVFLVTSRERLRLDGEQLFELPPLRLADEAVELFQARAAAQRGRFVVDATNRSAVESLVGLLDGLPLAIELAAARVGVLSPAQIVERMRDRFALLGAARAGTSRQSTLRAAIDWSWQLLSTPEQAALAQWAVFDGATSLALAEAVIDLSRWPDAPPVMDVVQALVDKSLLRSWVPADDGLSRVDEPQFGLYLGVREFALQQLSAGMLADRVALEQRHGLACAALCDDDTLRRLPLQHSVALRQSLMLTLDNLVAACRRAIARSDGSTALATCRGIRELLVRRGPYALSVELADAVHAIGGLNPRQRATAAATRASALRQVGQNEAAAAGYEQALAEAEALRDERSTARLRVALGGLDRERGRTLAARQRLADGLACGRRLGDVMLQIDAMHALAQLDTDQGETDAARGHLEAAIALARAAGESGTEAQLRMPLGVLMAEQGRFEEGRQHFESALRHARSHDDRRLEGELLTNLGCLDQDQGQLDAAALHFGQALALHRELGDRRWEGFVLGDLGRLQLLRGELDGAQRDIERSLEIMREIGNRRIEGSELRSLGDVHRQAGRVDDARRVYAEAERTLRPIGDRYYLAFVVCGQADLAQGSGQFDEARRLHADALALGEALGVTAGSELGRRLDALGRALKCRPGCGVEPCCDTAGPTE